MQQKVYAMWMESMSNRGVRVSLVLILALLYGACDGERVVRSSIVSGRTGAGSAPASDAATPVASSEEVVEEAPGAAQAPLVVTPPEEQEEAAGVVVMLHGYNSNHLDFKDVASLAASKGLIAISVPAPNVSGPMRFQWERDDVEGTHAYIQSMLLAAIDGDVKGLALKRPVKIWLMGFSQGGMYAAILSERYKSEYAGALAIAPAGWASVPEKCERERKEGRGVWVVTGKQERPNYAEKTAALVEHLKACDLLEERVEHEGGHQFPAAWRALFGRLFEEWAIQ